MEMSKIYNSEIMLYRSQKKDHLQISNNRQEKLNNSQSYQDKLEVTEPDKTVDELLQNKSDSIIANIDHIESEKFLRIKEKVKSGFYQNYDILSQTADNILDDLQI